MKRREFIILTGVGATSATMLSACGHPENKLIPALIPDNEYVPGLDYWKASACAMCPAGCGIVVRTREHKANKIEGNPLHPTNRGALCARGQAGIQALYDPDRIRGPMKRTGERGSGHFEEIGWDEAIRILADRIREIKAHETAHDVFFATNDPNGVTGLAAELFRASYKARMFLATNSLDRNSYASLESYGRKVTPVFDIANAAYLLSFGARFLETWGSPVMQSLAYGEFRRSSGKARGKFVQIEPRMSLTAANADEWLPAAAGAEGIVALAIAQVITREALIKDAPAPQFLTEPLENYAPEKIADKTDIAAEKIIRIAREFAASSRPLAIGGSAAYSVESNRKNLVAINFLNALVGSVNKPGGAQLPAYDDFYPLEKSLESVRKIMPFSLQGLARDNTSTPSRPDFLAVDQMLSKHVEASKRGATFPALLVHQVNPAYFIPNAIDAIKTSPFIASFSSFMDETTEMADLILPDHTYLESWNIQATSLAGKQTVVSVTQPVIKPELNTKQTADVLIALSREFSNASALPFQSAEQIVKQAIEQLPQAARASAQNAVKADEPDDFLKTVLEQGVWSGEVTGAVATYDSGPQARSRFSLLSAETIATADEYPLTLLTYEHAMLGFGQQANLPWLQELPDPMTSVMWGSWVEINPKTAQSLGIADGDLVEITSAKNSLRAPAVFYPAIRPDVIAMPYGQGHTAYGRYARNKGANAALLNTFSGDEGARSDAVCVKVSKVAGEVKLIRFGTDLLEKIETSRSR